MTNEVIVGRKNDHIRININENVNSSNTTGLEKFRLIHNALPEINFSEISTSTRFLQKNLGFPLLISSMTGGSGKADLINRRLAEAANTFNLAMGVGSQRIGLADPDRMETFKVRKYAPKILLFANLGAVQLNYGIGLDDCRGVVDTIEADALFLHLNPLQEILMAEGDKNFSNLLTKIENICRHIEVPVFCKEVGWGISADLGKKLIDVGVTGIDVAGAGGTSWSEVEKFRLEDPIRSEIAGAFQGWGIPTAECLINLRKIDKGIPLIASGGITNGINILKCLALGADLAGIARGFLGPAIKSAEALDSYIKIIIGQMKAAMMVTGVDSINDINPGIIQPIGDE